MLKILASKWADVAAAKIAADRLVAEQEANIKLDLLQQSYRMSIDIITRIFTIQPSDPAAWIVPEPFQTRFCKFSTALTALSLSLVLLPKNLNSTRTS